jgi:hypothetical protein
MITKRRPLPSTARPTIRSLFLAALCALALPAAPARAQDFEVWLVDQSNTIGLAHGGKILVYEGSDLMGESVSGVTPIATIDLAAETDALCFAATGAHVVRPHMLFFNATRSHAVLSFVASGHVVVFDAVSRTPVACLRASPGAGGARQAHAAFPSPDDRYIVVANQNGKLLERIDADFENQVFVLDPAATIDLANCVTPSGAPCQLAGVRPDNAPICPIVDSASARVFVTLRGGGLFVVDLASTPMRILAEYDRATVHGNGCGGAEAGGSMFINSGGGTASNLHEFDVYRFPLQGYDAMNPPNTPAIEVVFSDDAGGERDSHGTIVTRHDRYLWVGDRAANLVEVFDVETGAHEATLDLTGPDSDDPTPDLGDIAPSGNRAFFALRGPNPLSGDPHVATGTTPGLMVLQVTQGGRHGVVKGVVPVTNRDAAGIERADPHALRVRRR